LIGLTRCYPRRIEQCNRAIWLNCASSGAAGQPVSDEAADHDRVAIMFETVISGYGLGMLSGKQRDFSW
jgi:hypothetical protein